MKNICQGRITRDWNLPTLLKESLPLNKESTHAEMENDQN